MFDAPFHLAVLWFVREYVLWSALLRLTVCTFLVGLYALAYDSTEREQRFWHYWGRPLLLFALWSTLDGLVCAELALH